MFPRIETRFAGGVACYGYEEAGDGKTGRGGERSYGHDSRGEANTTDGRGNRTGGFGGVRGERDKGGNGGDRNDSGGRGDAKSGGETGGKDPGRDDSNASTDSQEGRTPSGPERTVSLEGGAHWSNRSDLSESDIANMKRDLNGLHGADLANDMLHDVAPENRHDYSNAVRGAGYLSDQEKADTIAKQAQEQGFDWGVDAGISKYANAIKKGLSTVGGMLGGVPGSLLGSGLGSLADWASTRTVLTNSGVSPEVAQQYANQRVVPGAVSEGITKLGISPALGSIAMDVAQRHPITGALIGLAGPKLAQQALESHIAGAIQNGQIGPAPTDGPYSGDGNGVGSGAGSMLAQAIKTGLPTGLTGGRPSVAATNPIDQSYYDFIDKYGGGSASAGSRTPVAAGSGVGQDFYDFINRYGARA